MLSLAQTLKELSLSSKFFFAIMVVGSIGCISNNLYDKHTKRTNDWHIGGMGVLVDDDSNPLGHRQVLIHQMSASGDPVLVEQDLLKQEYAKELAELKANPTPETATDLVIQLARHHNPFPKIDQPLFKVVIQDEVIQWNDTGSLLFGYTVAGSFTLLIEDL